VELREALAQIAEIRQQVARTETFRGYRAATVAFSGFVALSAGVVQSAVIRDAQSDVAPYLTLWCGAALLCLVATGVEMAVRARRNASICATELTWLAVEQFLPSVVAGGLLTFVVARFAGGDVWMLPGLWAMLFSLGIFASYRLLPRATFWVGAYYLLASVFALSNGAEMALSPWTMGGMFGVGQIAAAAILYQSLERTHV
jgi:hypothetical protein